MNAQQKGLILITGASGFVATHVVDAFLQRGYRIRATVRSEEAAQKVKQAHFGHNDQLSFAIVKDIIADGAFNEAVKDVDGVIHTASPFPISVKDNENDLLIPAIEGTTNILKAIKKNSPKVRRVVITSSFAAIVNLHEGLRPGYVYSEEDWNPENYDEAKVADYSTAYCASKALAEKAAFDFVATEDPHFQVATICPPMIYGPPQHAVDDMSNLNTSAADFYRLMNGSCTQVPDTAFFAFVDVRDVAEAHLRAYESSLAAGQRYLIARGSYTYQEIVDLLRQMFPQLATRLPSKDARPVSEYYRVSTEKAQSQLGMKFRSLEEVVKDTAEALLSMEESAKKQ